jgi:peptidoglycan/xylan/chitin deacetylase (PgdA/CDA1 family)
VRGGGPIPVLLATALLAPVATVGVPSASVASQPRPRERPASLSGSEAHPPPGPGPGQLYRIVGCRSRAAAAFLHGPARREVAIGFDDGPAPDTAAFVRMLERNHARATFFMVGVHLSGADRRLLARELHDGDTLGDHTFTHPDLTRLGAAGVRAELRHTLLAIRALSGYTPCVFRPPYGAYDQAVLRIAGSLGLATVLWNVDPSDWALPPVSTIVQRVLAQVRPGSIVISHDGGGPRGNTLAAYPRIIAALRARGYRIVTIPELLGFRPVYAPCGRRCGSLGIPRRRLPRNAIVERAWSVLGGLQEAVPAGAGAFASRP